MHLLDVRLLLLRRLAPASNPGLLGCQYTVRTLSAVVPPAGLYGVVGTGLSWDVSTLCAVILPAGLYGVVGTGLL
jgi:hypothetical protein